MRTFRWLVLGILLVAPASAVAEGKFIVHEWGTFTSFAGSDGVKLEFRPLVTSDLPAFVYDRARQSHYQYDRADWTKGTLHSLHRMETPVTYFYTDTERTVYARVMFPKGLLTEFYPPVRAMGPMSQGSTPPELKDSFLRWGKVTLLPPASPEGQAALAHLPAVKTGDHYGLARQTDSAIVRFCDTATTDTYYEKFLFYRGVGNFSLPMSATALTDDLIDVTDTDSRPLRSVFVVDVNHGNLRFASAGEVTGERKVNLPKEAASIDALGDAVTRSLVADGLYEKEAVAMVNTWKSSWFGEEGTRVFYVLPAAVTDELLPLKIDPKPDDTVRVMVGRMELMTPGRERRVEQSLLRDEVPEGRFAEPAVRRVREITTDAAVKAKADAVLAKLES